MIPGLGALLDPFSGMWNQAHNNFPFPSIEKVKSELKGSARVQIDKDFIPHIYAQNDEDLYFLQGYIIASQRLFQMDFTYRVGAARLSEIIGPQGLEFDKLFAFLDLEKAAEASNKVIMSDPQSRVAMESFTRGVNYYIRNLSKKDYPFEFKLLNYEPEEWTPFKSAIILKVMAFRLAGYSSDIKLTRTQHKLANNDDFKYLFPLYPDYADPILPNDIKYNFIPQIPKAPTENFLADWERIKPYPQPNPSNGSNNFAVDGSKSTTGFPIVANDLHLGYQMPALFYMIHLRSKDQNVMGATIPGAPGIIVGFNDKVSWAVTNGGSDVMDWYQIEFADEEKKTYTYEGETWPLEIKNREIKVRGASSFFAEIKTTHHGPIVYEKDSPISPSYTKGLAVKWLAHEPSNEILTFLKLNKSQNIAECRKSLSTYVTPQQNFLCADIENNLGIFPYGEFPARWPGMGRTVMDGTNKAFDWSSFVPEEHKPFQLNHPRGFASSANQHTFGANYPYYWNWTFDEPFRGKRINEVLSQKGKVSPQDLMRLQMDRQMLHAKMILPLMIKSLPTEGMSKDQTRLVNDLKSWDFEAKRKSYGPTFFTRWWRNLEDVIWEDQLGKRTEVAFPKITRTMKIIKDSPMAKWFDNIKTEEKVETLEDVLFESFEKTFSQLTLELGQDFRTWTFNRVQETKLPHLAKLPGFGVRNIEMDGQDMTVLANTGAHGPAWKMVVSLNPSGMEAWGAYPGGQSGHPFSKHYDSLVEPWSKGQLLPLRYSQEPITEDSELVFDWSYKKET